MAKGPAKGLWWNKVARKKTYSNHNTFRFLRLLQNHNSSDDLTAPLAFSEQKANPILEGGCVCELNNMILDESNGDYGRHSYSVKTLSLGVLPKILKNHWIPTYIARLDHANTVTI